MKQPWLFLLAALTVALPPALGSDHLVLHVNDAIAPPGGIASVVVRSYASRPIGQGQVCLMVDGRPFRSMEGLALPDPGGDARKRFEVVDPETILVQMLSPSASINEVEGPIFALYFRVRNNAVPGDRFPLHFDLLNTIFRDALGDDIAVVGLDGELRIRAHGAPISVEADGDTVQPGEIAELGLETFEPIRLASGQFGLRYPADVAGGPPEVRVLAPFGNAELDVDDSTPGLILVSFVSPDGSLNRMPGRIVDILLPTSPDVPPATMVPVTLDPALTFLIARDGRTLELGLEAGTLEFR